MPDDPLTPTPDDAGPHPLVRLGEAISEQLALGLQPTWDLIQLLVAKGVLTAEEQQRLFDRHEERAEAIERTIIARQAERRADRG